MGGNYQAVNINTTRYYTPLGHVNDTVETDVRIPVPAGKVNVLRVYYQPAAHGQTLTLTLMVNGVASALTCQVASNSSGWRRHGSLRDRRGPNAFGPRGRELRGDALGARVHDALQRELKTLVRWGRRRALSPAAFL